MSHSSMSPGSADFDQAVKLAIDKGNKRNLMSKSEELDVEDLVLRRCWLSRYWGLAARLGVYPDIAHKKHAGWAAVAPLPLKVVISAGQKAAALAMAEGLLISSAKSKKYGADESSGEELSAGRVGFEMEEETPLLVNSENSAIAGQLKAVDEALRELEKLKVEEAVLLKISHDQNPSLVWLGLSKEQAQDIQFKQAWLVYYWRRAQKAGMEDDVAGERLLYWISQINKPPNYQDAVNVHSALLELRSLGISNHDKIHSHAAQEALET